MSTPQVPVLRKADGKPPSLPSPRPLQDMEKTVGKGLFRGQWGLAPLSAFLHFSEHRESENRGEETERLRETGTQKTRDKDSEAPGSGRQEDRQTK